MSRTKTKELSVALPTAAYIQKILRSNNWTQKDLGDELDLDQGQISRYLSEDPKQQTKPSTIVCLMLAAIAEPKDQDFWIKESDVSARVLKKLAKLLGLPEQRILSNRQRKMLELIENPSDPGEKSLVDLLDHFVNMRANHD